MHIVIVNGRAFKYASNDTLKQLQDGVYEVKASKQDFRTAQQNRAIHLYFRLVADALNDAGLDIKEAIKADVSWSYLSVKELLWKPIQKAVTGRKSTTALRKDELDKVYDTINRLLGERFGISVPFPSIDDMLFDRKIKESK